MSPEMTPVRVTTDFLKEVGRGNADAASAWVMPESAGEIPNWQRMLYFPDHSNPPTAEEEAEIDHFIGLFYKFSVMNEGETQADVRMTFVASDALIGFPSVANNPLIPNTAMFDVTLVRTVTGEGEEAEYGEWRIGGIATAMVTNYKSAP